MTTSNRKFNFLNIMCIYQKQKNILLYKNFDVVGHLGQYQIGNHLNFFFFSLRIIKKNLIQISPAINRYIRKKKSHKLTMRNASSS